MNLSVKARMLRARWSQTFLQKDGTVTAGNASGINDGAAYCHHDQHVNTRHRAALPILATLKGYAGRCRPASITRGIRPVPAIQKLVARTADSTLEKVDVFRLNETFATKVWRVIKDEYSN